MCLLHFGNSKKGEKPLEPKQLNVHSKVCINLFSFFFLYATSHSQLTHNLIYTLVIALNFVARLLSYKRTANKFLSKQTVTSYYYICRINERNDFEERI